MLGRSVGILSACALGASALIIPPGIAPASNGEAPGLAISVVNPKERIIKLPCSECAFPTKEEKAERVEEDADWFWIQGGSNSLVLNFTVSEDGQRLQVNGGDIYPPHFQQDWAEQRAIYVKQVPSHADLVEVKAGEVKSANLEVTAYGVKEAEKQALSPNGDMLVPVTFAIMGLQNQHMTVDEVAIHLLKTGDGELLIMDVHSVPSREPSAHSGMFDGPSFAPPPPPQVGDFADLDFPPPPPPHSEGPPHPQHSAPKECSMLPEPLCKLRNMLESQIDQMMGHHGRPGFRKGGCRGRKRPHGKHLPSHIKTHFGRPGMDDGPNYHHGRPHHMRPHGPHHRHHGHSRHHFLHAFAKGMVAVLIPVMAGITVGMTVSLLGLVVGRLISFLWIKLARGGRRGHASVPDREIVLEEGEDKEMIAEMEAPPVYEHAPAYEEVAKEEK